MYSALVRRSFWDAHSGILGLVLSLGLTVTFTNIVKVCLSFQIGLSQLSDRLPLVDLDLISLTDVKCLMIILPTQSTV